MKLDRYHWWRATCSPAPRRWDLLSTPLSTMRICEVEHFPSVGSARFKRQAQCRVGNACLCEMPARFIRIAHDLARPSRRICFSSLRPTHDITCREAAWRQLYRIATHQERSTDQTNCNCHGADTVTRRPRAGRTTRHRKSNIYHR